MSAATETTLITWTPGTYSSFQGHAGGIHLFTINWKTVRTAPDWSMRTELPGTSPRDWQSCDKDELKATAEKVLASWIARVTTQTTETGN